MVRDEGRHNNGADELRLSEPVSHHDVLESLSDKSTLICVDTCVLIRMIPDKNVKRSGLDYFDFSKAQMEKCEKLLSEEHVGWIAPQQIKREFTPNSSQMENDVTEGLREKLVSGNFKDSSIEKLSGELGESITKIEDLAKRNRLRIVQETIVLEEARGNYLWNAWSLLNQDDFPNKKGQEMKDSMILCHLHSFADFSLQNKNGFKIYFWTFDTFGGYDSARYRYFPIGSTGETSSSITITRDITEIPIEKKI